MYPKNFLDLFPAYERLPQVFVAMSFHEPYRSRLGSIFEPAIVAAGLKAKCVIRTTVNDSILTEIMEDIGSSKLFFADLSGPHSIPSPNVAYEVGIAHATRQPQEVILFRDEAEKEPLFDLANVRIRRYSPKDVAGAIAMLTEAIEGAAKEIDQTKDRLVEKVAKVVDIFDWFGMLELMKSSGDGTFNGLLPDQPLVRLRVIDKLIEHGVIAIKYFPVFLPEEASPASSLPLDNVYELTPFGWNVLDKVRELADPREQEMIKKKLDSVRAAIMRNQTEKLIAAKIKAETEAKKQSPQSGGSVVSQTRDPSATPPSSSSPSTGS